jgi:hypothetical protein
MSTTIPRSTDSWRADVVITLLGVAGLILFLALYDQAFPSAALDLRLSRAEIERRAWAYMQTQGYNLGGYEFALTFGQDGWASYYLQRTLGVPETNRLIRAEQLPIWRWYARWFKPLQKEEFSITLTPMGDVIGFSHSVLEDAPGAHLSQDKARTLAEDYLARDRHWTLSDWEPVVASSHDKPGGRVDHYFEWKRRNYTLGESELRLNVEVQGDRLGDYSYWIKVPEAFQRQYAEQRNRADFYSNMSFWIGGFGLGLAATIAYFVGMLRGTSRWNAGFVPAVAVFAVGVLSGLNGLALSKAGYDTTQDYSLFWVDQAWGTIISAGFMAGMVAILWAGGRQLSRLAWPRRDKILPRGERRWEILSRSAWRGLMLGGLTLGYLVIFYLVATHLLGGWTPMGASVVEAYATPLPFLEPIASGLLPAMSEELMFRLVGIAVVLWLTGLIKWPKAIRYILALLIPGLLWAFAHLSYVRDPIYFRGIELTIVAVLFYGLLLARFDLTTTMVAHFAWNSMLGALPLLRSGQPFFVFSGVIVLIAMLTPVLPGLVQRLRRVRQRDLVPVQPEIVPATGQDLIALMALAIEGADWESWLIDPAITVLCLRMNEDIIGVAAGRVEAEGVAMVLAVYVAPAWRRRYWASTLADQLCQSLAARGVRWIEVASETGDRVAVAFWASLGWRVDRQVFARSLQAG